MCNLGSSIIHKSSWYVRGETRDDSSVGAFPGAWKVSVWGQMCGVGAVLSAVRAEGQILSDRGTQVFVNTFIYVCVFVICKPMYLFFFFLTP